jgi:hypothetical protein
MGRLLEYVVAHEVGHTLGFPHNFRASASMPVDSLRSRSYTARWGDTPSIMDYARFNYVAQPGDNAFLIPTVSVYDSFAVNWGYRRLPGAATPEAERPYLDSLARLQDANPMLRFSDRLDGVDPNSQREAVGDDPVKASTYGLMNLKRVMHMLIPATTANRLEDYGDLNEMYAFLNANVFKTPDFFFDAEILRRVEPTGYVERIRTEQTTFLTNLFNDSRLSRLAEQGATASNPYTIADLLGDVRRGVFSEEAARRVTVDAYRRNLQRAFVDEMDRLINTPLNANVPTRLPAFPGFVPPPPRPADARALARATLQELERQLRTAAPRAADPVTRAHLADLRYRIDRVLNPRGGPVEARPAVGFPGMFDGIMDW